MSLTLLAPHATLIFKIFLSPLDPHAAMLKAQLRPFFIAPDDIDPTDSSSSQTGEKAGFDLEGRRGGVWVRKRCCFWCGTWGLLGEERV